MWLTSDSLNLSVRSPSVNPDCLEIVQSVLQLTRNLRYLKVGFRDLEELSFSGRKYLSLLILFNAKAAMVASILISVLVGVLRMMAILPNLVWTQLPCYTFYYVVLVPWRSFWLLLTPRIPAVPASRALKQAKPAPTESRPYLRECRTRGDAVGITNPVRGRSVQRIWGSFLRSSGNRSGLLSFRLAWFSWTGSAFHRTMRTQNSVLKKCYRITPRRTLNRSSICKMERPLWGV